MRFALSEEQRQLGASVGRLLADADVPALARAWAAGSTSLDLVGRLAKVGVTGLAVPERCGGLAASPVDLVVVFEELGRHAAPGPLVESVAVAPALLAELPAAEELLCDLAAGRRLATVVLPPHVPHALDADVATVLVVDGDTVRAGVPGARLTSVDATRRLFEARPGEPLGPAGPAFDVGVLCCAAQLLGLGAALLDKACAHARERRQFGRPIGSFQAVQHLLADVHVGLELARPLVHAAAVTSTFRDISAAKIAAADAAYRAARAALQVHGAIGYTLEHDLGLWLTKVRALRSAWGTPAWHRERVLASLTSRRSR